MRYDTCQNTCSSCYSIGVMSSPVLDGKKEEYVTILFQCEALMIMPFSFFLYEFFNTIHSYLYTIEKDFVSKIQSVID